MLKVNNNIIKVNNKWLNAQLPPGPSLPPYTLRLKFAEGVTPSLDYGTFVQVSSSPNIWDYTYENSDWSELFYDQQSLLEVIDGNTTGVTNMYRMFYMCQNLTAVSLFDTSSVTNAEGMFYYCYYITSIPLFDTSSMTNMQEMFSHCLSVESGALALYQQASSQLNPPSNHLSCFANCGVMTTTGLAELNQIPSDWK
jgi:surface protein